MLKYFHLKSHEWPGLNAILLMLPRHYLELHSKQLTSLWKVLMCMGTLVTTDNPVQGWQNSQRGKEVDTKIFEIFQTGELEGVAKKCGLQW